MGRRILNTNDKFYEAEEIDDKAEKIKQLNEEKRYVKSKIAKLNARIVEIDEDVVILKRR